MHPYYAVDTAFLANAERIESDTIQVTNISSLDCDEDLSLQKPEKFDITQRQETAHTNLVSETQNPENYHILSHHQNDGISSPSSISQESLPLSTNNVKVSEAGPTDHTNQVQESAINSADLWPRGHMAGEVGLTPTSHLRPIVPKALQKLSPSPQRRRGASHISARMEDNSEDKISVCTGSPGSPSCVDGSPSKDQTNSPRTRQRRFQKKKTKDLVTDLPNRSDHE